MIPSHISVHVHPSQLRLTFALRLTSCDLAYVILRCHQQVPNLPVVYFRIDMLHGLQDHWPLAHP